MPSGGSHPKYSNAVRAMLEAHIRAGVRSCDIVREMRVSKSWVSALRSSYEVFGIVSPAHLGVQGRPRKIYTEAEEGIYDFLLAYPTARRDEVCDFLFDEFDIECSVYTVGRVLRRIYITLKVAGRVHTEQDSELRATYLARVTHNYSAD